VTSARRRTNGHESNDRDTSAASPRQDRDDDPRHVADALRDELRRLDEGDAFGAREVLTAFAELLEGAA
jgi:hypothetical protein